MPGINFFYNLPNIKIDRNERLFCQTIEGSNFQINRFTLNKFMDDKLFVETNDLIIVIEGVILNKRKLLEIYKHNSWEELVYILYKNDKNFFKEFRGSFSGLVYDKELDESIIFTDHLGTKPLYYYSENKSLLVSSEISDIYTYFKKENISYQLDVNAAYNLLSYGYMIADDTLCKKIKKLQPGTCIHLKENQIGFLEYYKLPIASKTTDLNEDEIITKIDEKFRKAIALQFDKDKEYGYKHFVALSGGLDSRMTSWVAHEMGYDNQINFTFSQSNYLDETIPKTIASDLKHEWIFKSLDNGIFLKDIEEINLISGGNVLYYGLAHSNSMFKLINFENLGVLHSGQLGDIVLGSFIKSLTVKDLEKLNGAYSKTLLKNSEKKSIGCSPEVIEQKLIYQRGINGANNGLIISQKYSETISPFYDIEFFEFCLSIPIELRMGHNLYKKWILQKYPKAAGYIWEKTGEKISISRIKFKGSEITFLRMYKAIVRRMRITAPSISTKNHMNPLDYWYKSNSDIKGFQDNYFLSYVNEITFNDELKAQCEKLYYQGSAIEKNLVLTLISAVLLFFKKK